MYETKIINAEKAVEAKDEANWKAGHRAWLIVLTLGFVSLIVALDATILVTALPTISANLNGSGSASFWVGTSYLLASSVLMPFMGSLSDILGRREILSAALFFFTVGSIVAGVSQSMDILLLGRVLQGIGGAGILPMTQIVLCDIVPLRFRPKYASVSQIAWAIGSITGPMIGGLLVQHVTWRWIFYLNLPFCGVGIVLVPFVIRLKTQKSSITAKLGRIDWLGGLLFIGSMTAFLMAVTWGGVNHTWDSAATLVPLLVGIAGTVLSIIWEKWGTREPFIRLAIFSNRSALAGYYCAMTQGLVLFIQVYYLALFFSSVKALSPVHTGVVMIAMSSVLVPTGVVVSLFITRTGRIRWALWSGWAFEIFASGLLILMDRSIATWRWVLILMTVGLGHGLLLQALTFVPQAMAKDTDESYAATMYNFSRTFGMAFGVAIGGTMFQNRLKQYLASAGLDITIANNADQYVGILETMTNQSLRSDILAAYESSFRNVFELGLALTVLGALVSLLIRKSVFDRKHVSKHVLEERYTSSPQDSVSSESV
ncbi:efflux pump antibiotic resistance protein, putative [Talaromyces stipitatus ATCC 10500]|uniref:Efflux pump antibiotic resistance protein, putative n=1 Tax=Talaromyces stipitatus (strain ATCC 10500 / CBS 375.48 / QM 6759 / NRRL 1006) TaxID=441959 RepID=B8MHG1_TALSN|nr:efflux pump antibiotic resistance protein, putative [Talaromyces stipitatus ATCC 10500]EED17140.1 efflux pump antibiotic resistance protein, putative [Talaromyces stipitatus ATCC 10500]